MRKRDQRKRWSNERALLILSQPPFHASSGEPPGKATIAFGSYAYEKIDLPKLGNKQTDPIFAEVSSAENGFPQLSLKIFILNFHILKIIFG